MILTALNKDKPMMTAETLNLRPTTAKGKAKNIFDDKEIEEAEYSIIDDNSGSSSYERAEMNS